jgi:hypothetical protein
VTVPGDARRAKQLKTLKCLCQRVMTEGHPVFDAVSLNCKPPETD